MKQPRKPTRNEKEAILAHGLNPDKWAVLKVTDFYIQIVHKESGEKKRVDRHTKLKNADSNEWVRAKRGQL